MRLAVRNGVLVALAARRTSVSVTRRVSALYESEFVGHEVVARDEVRRPRDARTAPRGCAEQHDQTSARRKGLNRPATAGYPHTLILAGLRLGLSRVA
jgi:hypothetical protein